MTLTARLVIVTVLVVVVGLVWLLSRRMLRRRLERETRHPQDGPWPPGRRVRDMTRLGQGLLALTGVLVVTNLAIFVLAPGSRISLAMTPVMVAVVGGALYTEQRRIKDL